MGIIKRISGWHGIIERTEGSATEAPVLSKHPTLPSDAISQDWESLFLQHQLWEYITQSSKYWQHHPAKLDSGRKECWLHTRRTCGVLFFWRSSRQILRQSLSCVALEQWQVFSHPAGSSGTNLKSLLMGDSFDLSFQVPVALPCRVCCCCEVYWLHPTWTCSALLLSGLGMQTLAETE